MRMASTFSGLMLGFTTYKNGQLFQQILLVLLKSTFADRFVRLPRLSVQRHTAGEFIAASGFLALDEFRVLKPVSACRREHVGQ